LESHARNKNYHDPFTCGVSIENIRSYHHMLLVSSNLLLLFHEGLPLLKFEQKGQITKPSIEGI